MRVGIRVALLLALMGLGAGEAAGQTLLARGPGVRGASGGSRNVLFAGGRYYVFFDDGEGVVYRESADGRSFSEPVRVGTPGASLGYAVARHGSRLGLAWAHQQGGVSTLYYREAPVGSPLVFGPVEKVDSASGVRGYNPALLFSAEGVPFISAVGEGLAYSGPLLGCGAASSARLNYYLRSATGWVARGYCNNFQLAAEPSASAIALAGNTVVPSAGLAGVLSAAIANPEGTLGEPWRLFGDVSHQPTVGLSAAQGAGASTDIHYLYVNLGGEVAYGRQDGTNTDANATGSELTVIAPGAAWPSLSRPATSTGCVTLAYASGNTLQWRAFREGIASVGAAVTAASDTAPITHVSTELEAELAPAVTWQVGEALYFGVLSGDGTPPGLSASPSEAPADGASRVSLRGGPFLDACGTPVPAGTRVTVTSTAGTVVEVDLDSELEGTQLETGADGSVSFTLRAPTKPMGAWVSVLPSGGGATAQQGVSFGGASLPSVPGAGEPGDALPGPELDVPLQLRVGCGCGGAEGAALLPAALLLLATAGRRSPAAPWRRRRCPRPPRIRRRWW